MKSTNTDRGYIPVQRLPPGGPPRTTGAPGTGTAVTHGALGICGLVSEQQPWIDRATERCTDYLKYAVDPTGAPQEGISYLSYGLHFVIPFAISLQKQDRRGYIASSGSSDRPGVLHIPNYIMWQTYPWGGKYGKSSNQDGGLEPAEGVFYLLTRDKDQTGLWSWLYVVGNEGNGTYGQRNWLGLGACLPLSYYGQTVVLKPSVQQLQANLYRFSIPKGMFLRVPAGVSRIV